MIYVEDFDYIRKIMYTIIMDDKPTGLLYDHYDLALDGVLELTDNPNDCKIREVKL